MSDEKIKNGVIILMIFQIILFIFGVVQLFSGHIFIGLFNILANAAFFYVNLNTLKIVKERLESES